MWKDTWRRAARTGQAAAVAMGLLASPALAYQITVGTTTYDIGFVNTSYDANPGVLTSQPWWGNPTLAQDIVDALLLDGFSTFTDFGVNSVFFAHTLVGGVTVEVEQILVNIDTGTTTTNTFLAVPFATGTIIPAAVPEIDGNALAKALFILFALGAWLHTRRRRTQGASPRIVLAG